MKQMVFIVVVLILGSHAQHQALAGGAMPAARAPADHRPSQFTPARPEQATPTSAGSVTPPARRSMAGPIFGVVLVFIASTVALGFALGLRKRINAIARPPPEDDED